jgi:hypothetical protein
MIESAVDGFLERVIQDHGAWAEVLSMPRARGSS